MPPSARCSHSTKLSNGSQPLSSPNQSGLLGAPLRSIIVSHRCKFTLYLGDNATTTEALEAVMGQQFAGG